MLHHHSDRVFPLRQLEIIVKFILNLQFVLEAFLEVRNRNVISVSNWRGDRIRHRSVSRAEFEQISGIVFCSQSLRQEAGENLRGSPLFALDSVLQECRPMKERICRLSARDVFPVLTMIFFSLLSRLMGVCNIKGPVSIKEEVMSSESKISDEAVILHGLKFGLKRFTKIT